MFKMEGTTQVLVEETSTLSTMNIITDCSFLLQVAVKKAETIGVLFNNEIIQVIGDRNSSISQLRTNLVNYSFAN